MTENEPKLTRRRLDETLTAAETRVLRLANRGELPCPRCGQPLHGDRLSVAGIYAGIVLVCLQGCGLREY